ncbi:MAG: hypothetical protein JW785_04200 [Acidimicrobiia bacterium]|nr:hypothetical protein [Acidimicrobiia bacterium]
MAQTQLKRHPVRAALWGLILGLGVFVYLTFVWPVIGLDDWKAVALKGALVVGGVMLLSIFWGLFGPAKKPKGPAPAYVPAAAPQVDEAPPAPMEEAPPASPLEEAPPGSPEDEINPPPTEG